MGQVGYGRRIAWGDVPSDRFATPCFEELPRTFNQCLKMHQKYGSVRKTCAICGCKLKVKKLKTGRIILRCTKLKKHEEMGFKAKEYTTRSKPAWMTHFSSWENFELERMLWLRAHGVSLKVIGMMFKSNAGLTAEAVEKRMTRFHERYRN